MTNLCYQLAKQWIAKKHLTDTKQAVVLEFAEFLDAFIQDETEDETT